MEFGQWDKKSIYTFEGAYMAFNFPTNHHSHPGHPPCPSSNESSNTVIENEAGIYSKELYKKQFNTSQNSLDQSDPKVTSHDINKELYYLATEHESRAPTRHGRTLGYGAQPCYKEVEKSSPWFVDEFCSLIKRYYNSTTLVN